MPAPSFTFGFILATMFGAAFHLFVGGDARRLALYLLAGWVGFTLGHLTGIVFELNFLNIGPLRIVPASIGAIIALVVAFSLSSNDNRHHSSR